METRVNTMIDLGFDFGYIFDYITSKPGILTKKCLEILLSEIDYDLVTKHSRSISKSLLDLEALKNKILIRLKK